MVVPKRMRFRVFISSPGDVQDERRMAREVLDALQSAPAFQDKVELVPVLWDDPKHPTPLEAGASGQSSVDRYQGLSKNCDLVVAIISSRLGSPALLADGTSIPSGTVYEVDLALQHGVPVWIYRQEQPRPAPSDGLKHWLHELQRVDEFFDSPRFLDAAGRRIGETIRYKDAESFADLLRKHLTQELQLRLVAASWIKSVPPAPDLAHFIDGSGRLDEVMEAITVGQHTCIVGAAGYGKTLLASAVLAKEDLLREHYAGVLWMEYGSRPELTEQLRRWASEVGVPQEMSAALATEADWMREICARIQTRRVLVVLDDLWSPDPVNDWLSRLPHAVFLITTRSEDQVVAEIDAPVTLVNVQPLDADESLQLMTHVAPKATTLAPGWVKEVADWMAGFPLALKLIAGQLENIARRGSLDTLEEEIRAFYDDTVKALNEASPRHRGGARQVVAIDAIIGSSFLALESDAAREALLDLSVFRPKPCYFDRATAEQICGIENFGAVVRQLLDLQLIECRTPDGGLATEYTLHLIVQLFANAKLSALRKTQLQNKLLSWYAGKIDLADQHGVVDQYELWYRYEHDRWQTNIRNWVYYLSKCENSDDAQIAFLRVYFDAWWWWGFFQSFDFCTRLIAEWKQRDMSATLRKRLKVLEDFQADFPTGMGPRGKRSGWMRAKNALLTMRDGVEQYLKAAGARPDDALRVRAFIDFALAECAAFGDKNFEHAIAFLDQSRESLLHHLVNDSWSARYILGYQSDYLLQAGQPQPALAVAQRGLRECATATGSPDPEQQANLWMSVAIAQARLGDAVASLAAWKRAMFCAFAFQAYPEPADTYTIQFFDEVCQRFCDQLAELPAIEAAKLAEQIRSIWMSLWPGEGGAGPEVTSTIRSLLAARSPGGLRPLICPKMPSPDSREELTALTDRVRTTLPQMALHCDEEGLFQLLIQGSERVRDVMELDQH